MFKSWLKKLSQSKSHQRRKHSIFRRNQRKSTLKNIKSSFKGSNFDLISLISYSNPFFNHSYRIRFFNTQNILLILRPHILFLIFMTRNRQCFSLRRIRPTSQGKMHRIYWYCRKYGLLCIESIQPSAELLLFEWFLLSFAELLER